MSSSKEGVFSVFKQDKANRQAPFYCRWTAEEDHLLAEAVRIYGIHKWSLIASHIPGRTPVQCSTRWQGALNPDVQKGRWSKVEDEALTDAVTSYLNSAENAGENIPWSKVATAIPNRTGIQCQARWTEALDPTVRKGRWKKEEDELLRSGVERFGCCWIRVAGYIPSRTQRQCRTRWNQLQSKQNRITTTTKKKTKLKPNTELPVRFHLQTRKDAIVIPSEILSPPSSPLTEATCPSPVSDYSTDSGSISAADATQILDMYDACFNHYLMNFDEPSNFLSLHLS